MWSPIMKFLFVGQAEMHCGNHRPTQRWLVSLGMDKGSLQGAFLHSLACCSRRRPSAASAYGMSWVTRISFTWPAWHWDSSCRKSSCCLCTPHICLIIPMVFRRFLLSPPRASQELWDGLWIEGGMSHSLYFTCCTCVLWAPLLCSSLCFVAGGSSVF